MSTPWHHRYAQRTQRMGSSMIRELLKLTQKPEIISFAGGLPAPEMFPVEAFEAASSRVLRQHGNLAMNALEAKGAATALEVWVGALNEQWLQLCVRDDGPGIAEDVIDRVFDPFFTTRAQGTGLGLAVVAVTVARCGGEIAVHNRPRGGAEFLITLPIAAAVLAAPAPEAAAAAPAKPREVALSC